MLLLFRDVAEQQRDANKSAQQEGERAGFGQFWCSPQGGKDRVDGTLQPPSVSWLPCLIPPFKSHLSKVLMQPHHSSSPALAKASWIHLGTS